MAGGSAREPLRLDPADSITLGYGTDFHVLLRAIGEAMPEDAVLCLEGTDIGPVVTRFVEVRQPAEVPETEPNTIWPKPRFLHLPIAGTNLPELLAVSEGGEEYEVADHFVVYRGDQVLLWAHDAGDGYVRVWKSLDAATVERLRSALGDSLRPEGPTVSAGP